MQNNPSKPRLTIGILIESLVEEYQAGVWTGVSEVAAAHDVNLICFAGGILYFSGEKLTALRTAIYDLASPENVDGLVVSGSLGSYIQAQDYVGFLKRYRPLPLAVTVRCLPDTPFVLADQYQGMRDLLLHMVTVHGLRRIAFIRGPETNEDANHRYQAYLDVLAEHAIPFDPRLVLPGAFDTESGIEAIRILCDERGLRPRRDFEAVVASSDQMALSALDALRARGISVPREVAVAGFDNWTRGRFAAPPLTTVQQPTHELGQRAAEMVLAQIAGRQPPVQETLPTELLVRQSCGCPPPAAICIFTPEAPSRAPDAPLAARREAAVEAMARAVGAVAGGARQWVEQLVDAFLAELDSPGAFIPVWRETILSVIQARRDPTIWQAALSTLHRYLPPDQTSLARANALSQEIQWVTEEIIQQDQARRRLAEFQQSRILREIGDALSMPLEMGELMDAVAQHFPRLGIRRCYITLYSQPECMADHNTGDDAQGCLVIAYDERGRVEPGPRGRPFPLRQLVPPDLLPHEQRYTFYVMPLLFYGEQLGFAVLDMGPAEGQVYESLRELLGSALKRVLLRQDRLRVEEELARERDLLHTLMDTVPDAIYFKDTSSRFVRVNRAQARTLGVDDPADVVGKTDFDFFLPAHAQDAYADEQAIIQSGQPLTDKLERIRHADGQMHWVSTTKIPIRDHRGQIVGTAGITRDITERIRAEERLRQYATELEEANEDIKRFAFIVSHDLRAPLVNLKGFAVELQDAMERIRAALDEVLPRLDEAQRRDLLTAMDEDVPEALEFINSSVAYMDRFISALLKLSRLGRQELKLEPIDMDALVRATLETLAHQLAEREAEVTVAPLPTIIADRTSMEQIVGNILGNAVKYLRRDRPGKIEITAEENEHGIIFHVRDNGRGIAAHDMDKVFAPFRRAGVQDVPGEGMGLAYVQTLVRRHDGKIWCESEPGVGTTFSFRLPHHTPGGGR